MRIPRFARDDTPVLVRRVMLPLLVALGCTSRASLDPATLRRLSENPAAQARPLVLANVHIIDGTGAPAIERGWIEIDRGHIGRMGAGSAPALGDAQVVDLAEHTVYPGLSDMHVHIGRLSQAKWMLTAMLANGVTSVKEPGNWAGADGVNHDVYLRQWLATNPLVPHVYVSGWTMSGAPGHPMDSGPALRKMIDDNIALKVDFFKTHQAITRAGLAEVSRVAKQRNVYHTGHVPAYVRSMEAVDSGLTVIEHLEFRPSEVTGVETDSTPHRRFWADADLDSPTVQHLVAEWERRKDRFFFDPTLSIYQSRAVQRGLRPDWPHNDEARVVSPAMQRQRSAGKEPGISVGQNGWGPPPTDSEKEAYARAARNEARFVAMVYRRGVRVLSGTDMPLARLAPGEGLLRELEIFVEGGLTPLEAIHSSTGVAAQVFRRTDRGTIAPGQVADLVIVRGNVATNISAIRNIEHVVLGGRFLDPAALLASARALAAADTAALAPGEP